MKSDISNLGKSSDGESSRIKCHFSLSKKREKFCRNDKKVKNVKKCCGNCAEKWTAEFLHNFCSFFLLGHI